MSVRSYIFSLITTDPILNELGVNAASTFTTHTVDTPQVRPLCILRWQAVNEGMGPVNQRILTVWVHDARNVGDYTRIDRSLKRLRALLTGVEGVRVGDMYEWLSGIRWEGDSDDLDDDALNTITRNAQFRLTGSAI